MGVIIVVSHDGGKVEKRKASLDAGDMLISNLDDDVDDGDDGDDDE